MAEERHSESPEQSEGTAREPIRNRRKGQASLLQLCPPPSQTHPGLSLLLLLEWTVKTVSFSWSQ